MPQTIDYNALAKKAGAVSSTPAATDYTALAKQAGAVSSTSTAAQASPAAPFDNRTAIEVMQDQSANVIRGIPQAITGIPGAIMGGGDAVMDMIRGKGTAKAQGLLQQVFQPVTASARGVAALVAPNSVQAPAREEWDQAAQGAGANLGATLLGAGASGAWEELAVKYPSKVRAGAKFEAVMKKAKDVPLKTTSADEAVARAQELRTRGSSMPKVLNDYVKNRKAATGDFMGTQVADPMTYEVGRDFASNSGAVSAKEATRINAQMKAQVSKFATAMKTANREAAASVGMGDVYDQAMVEYRRAANVEEAAKVVKKWVGRGVLTALGLKGAQELIDNF